MNTSVFAMLFATLLAASAGTPLDRSKPIRSFTIPTGFRVESRESIAIVPDSLSSRKTAVRFIVAGFDVLMDSRPGKLFEDASEAYSCTLTNYTTASYRDQFQWAVVGSKHGELTLRIVYPTGPVLLVSVNPDNYTSMLKIARELQPTDVSGTDQLSNTELIKAMKSGDDPLSWEGQRKLTDELFPMLAAAFPDARYPQGIPLALDGTSLPLKKLHCLSNTKIDSIWLSRVRMSSDRLHQLSLLKPRKLVLRRNLLKTRDLRELASMVSTEELDVSFNLIHDFRCSYPLLKSLDLSGNPVKSIGLPHTTHLKTLGLRGCNLSPSVVNGMRCPTLEVLDMSFNKLGGKLEGWLELDGFPVLTYLDFRGNRLKNSQVGMFAALRKLRFLDLRGNSRLSTLNWVSTLKNLDTLGVDCELLLKSNPKDFAKATQLRLVVLPESARARRKDLPKIEGVRYEFW